jgi:hypothetical protein
VCAAALSGDGVALDGDMLYYPETRSNTATTPGDWATRELVPNPVTRVVNVTQTFIEHLDKVPLSATGSAVSTAEGGSFSGPVATVTDPNNGRPASDYAGRIDWGDGTPATPGTVTGGAGSYTIGGSHA